MEAFRGTILVIDDETDTCEVMRDRLESMGYQAVTATTGKQGLELLERHTPHLVLLDIEMPGMNGLEVLKEIRKREPDVVVVMITAHGTLERAVQAMREGADDFIPKPFEPDHMALIVKKALERETLRRGVELLSEELDH
ncbi:MAG: response regulator, partial [Deltaproteobacteria bacterium]|nr:response regulator [Deltaproteobacteria bacterium]